MAGGVLTASWTGSFSRTPTAYVPGPPPLSPLAVPIANTAGQWLFAFVSWRQDTGTAGLLTYPSTITMSDDVNNFWIPVQTVTPQTGIVRCAVWMAPAARAAGFVYVSPTSYQSAITVLIGEFTANCPWYSVAAVVSNYTNQGTSITASLPANSGLFSVGVLTVDSDSVVNSGAQSGWATFTNMSTVTASNGTDSTGDLKQFAFYGTAGAGTNTWSDSVTGGNADFGEVIITVHGVTDSIPFPYATPLENWPVLITEIASGPVLNADPVMLQGTAFWSVTNGSGAAVTWPAYQPYPNYQALITPSLSATPTGSSAFMTVISEKEPVSLSTQYTCLAEVYSVAGYNQVIPQIIWYNSGGAQIGFSSGTVYSVLAGTWTTVTFPSPAFPPQGAAFGAAAVAENALVGNVPSSAVLYVGYCGFGPADAYENAPLDEIAWTDVSSRNFTQNAISISRGVQYEQQSLEAGTMTVTLANNDGAMMLGNILSAYWPTIGDTDVPIRLRAIWWQSATPYYVLFSGFTDDTDFQWDAGTRYGYATFEASDAWSRLTSQLLGAAEQELLFDGPDVYCTCSQSGANLAAGNTTPMIPLVSQLGAGTATSTFGGSGISPAGDSGTSCWQSSNTPIAAGATQGVALGYFPPNPITVTTTGVTAEFWMSPTQPTGGQPATWLTVCTCWSRKGPMWTISVKNTAGAASSTASITVYDQNTGVGTSTTFGAGTFLGATTAAEGWQFAVTFTQTSLTAVSSPGGTQQQTVTVGCNLTEFIVGFSFGGNAGPVYGYNNGGTVGFMNIAVYGFAVFTPALPPARLAAHHQAALNAYPSQIDTQRLALIAGYAGATPAVLGMRGLDLGTNSFAPDLDIVTAATDTAGQVASSYFTNIAASTLAFMYVNGPGVLQYRRRLETYVTSPPQWAVGDLPPLPLNANTLGQSASLTGWSAQNGATLTESGAIGNVNPLFDFAGVFHGDGSTASPQIGFTSPRPAVTPGNWYSLSALWYSPQGFASGTSFCYIRWMTAGLSQISLSTSVATVVGAGSLTFITTGAAQAPATAAFAELYCTTNGTPASSVLFYVTDVQFILVPATTAGGIGATAAEAPYMIDAKLSADRALMFNQAILTQYGTSTKTTFTGPNLVFAPTSGVTVIISNLSSITARAEVPYTATLYLDNTAQALPYYIYEPSMEDFGNWITQTLASALLRPEVVTITPAATPQSMLTALGAEVGDTFTYQRRPLGAPEIQQVAYCSKLSHDIDISSGHWDTRYELSPFPQGVALACDDVIHGTLTGGNLLGW